jgi:hypothetical protein
VGQGNPPTVPFSRERQESAQAQQVVRKINKGENEKKYLSILSSSSFFFFMHVPLRLPHVAAIGGSGAKTTKRELFCVSAGEPQPTHHPPPTAFLLLLPSHLHHAFTSSRGRKTEQEGVGGGRRGGEGSPCILLNRLQTEKKKKRKEESTRWLRRRESTTVCAGVFVLVGESECCLLSIPLRIRVCCCWCRW